MSFDEERLDEHYECGMAYAQLKTELDTLRAERDDWRTKANAAWGSDFAVFSERDALKKELAQLKRDRDHFDLEHEAVLIANRLLIKKNEGLIGRSIGDDAYVSQIESDLAACRTEQEFVVARWKIYENDSEARIRELEAALWARGHADTCVTRICGKFPCDCGLPVGEFNNNT